MIEYDRLSTVLYAIGRAIDTEDDPVVKEQLEDLEEKMTRSVRIVRNRKLLKVLEG